LRFGFPAKRGADGRFARRRWSNCAAPMVELRGAGDRIARRRRSNCAPPVIEFPFSQMWVR
jgi:hypothetical protein